MSLALFYQDGAAVAATTRTVAEMTPDMECRVVWRPQQFNRCANPGFETDTTGWAVTVGINGVGTSVTRITTDKHSGSACGQVVTTAAGGSGVHYALSSDFFFRDDHYATVYLARLWLRRVSGAKRYALIFGNVADSTARATLYIDDLPDTWREYSVAWRPTANLSINQVAIVALDKEISTFRVDDLSVYSPQPSQVENGSFESSVFPVFGWDIGSNEMTDLADPDTFVGATGSAFGGNGHAILTTTAAADSAVQYGFGQRSFLSGRTYRLRVGLRWVSGPTTARLRFGSRGTVADRGQQDVTITTEWAWYTCDWTPSADRTDAALAIGNSTAAIRVMRVDEVEAYEALDEVRAHEIDTTIGTMAPGNTYESPTGSSALVASDTTGLYDARNPDSVLYGYVKTGLPVYARAAWGGRLYPVLYGRVQAQSADPDAESWSVRTGDGLAAIEGVDITREFASDLSYADARRAALLAAGVGSRQFALDATGPESATFFDGTDGPTGALAYLEALNSATGTMHYAAPSVHANVGWVYTTVSRTVQTDDRPGVVISDDSRGPLPVNEQNEDSVVTKATIGWHGYEILQPAAPLSAVPWVVVLSEDLSNGRGIVAIGADRATWPDLLPYIVYTDDAYGSTDAPEPEVVISVRRYTVRNKKGKRVGRKHRRRYVRWDTPIFPMEIQQGAPVEFVIDFAIPMEDVSVIVDAVNVDTSYTVEPGRVVLTMEGNAGFNVLTTVYGIAVVARPWFPKPDDEETERVASDVPTKEANGVDESYINGAGQAQGLARYLCWRYGEARLRPVLRDGMQPVRQLTVMPGSHIAATVSKYHIVNMPTLVRGRRHRITRPYPWYTEYAVEELPSGNRSFFTLGGGASKGIGSTAVLGY